MPLKDIREDFHRFLSRPPGAVLAAGPPRETLFSRFDPAQEREAARLVTLLWQVAESTGGEAGLAEALKTAQLLTVSHGESMTQFVVTVFVIHSPLGRRLVLPTFFERYPDLVRMFADSTRLAASHGPEQALDWWREDPFFNEHHEHWHLVYLSSGVNGQLKDRHGELFLAMHQQMLARYDTERLCANLPRVVPLDTTATVPEAYTPAGLAYAYTARPANQQLLPLETDQGPLPVALLDHWKTAIEGAIDAEQFVADDGTLLALNQPEHADLLGNSIEASVDTPSIQSYGSLHNVGHGIIAGSPRPAPGSWRGVMSYPWTSAMDPVFWRWHKLIDDLSVRFQNRLDRHDFADAPVGISIRDQDLIVVRADQVPNFDDHDSAQLGTWAEQTFGGAAWDTDFAGDASTADSLKTFVSQSTFIPQNPPNVPVTLSYGDHEDFAYVLRVENTENRDRDATVRLWLCLESETDERRSWIEMDTFKATIPAVSKTVLYRSARQSSVVRKSGGLAPRPPTLETPPGDFDRDDFDDDYCECGWPYSLLLPRGTAAGTTFRLMSLVTENDVDMQGHTPTCGSVSMCGASNLLYPDKRPMGYPFNRRWPDGQSIVDTIGQQQHMASRALQIRHG